MVKVNIDVYAKCEDRWELGNVVPKKRRQTLLPKQSVCSSCLKDASGPLSYSALYENIREDNCCSALFCSALLSSITLRIPPPLVIYKRGWNGELLSKVHILKMYCLWIHLRIWEFFLLFKMYFFFDIIFICIYIFLTDCSFQFVLFILNYTFFFRF